eukprot:6824837-Prymnesium_polylepis.3
MLEQEVKARVESELKRFVTEQMHILRSAGGVGVRRYGSAQPLTVRLDDGTWADAEVNASGVVHRLTISGGSELELELHPWNHAPRELVAAEFDRLRSAHLQALREQHSFILDALSGRPLDVLEQCVAIDVTDMSSTLRWYCAGTTEPDRGRRLTNKALENALQGDQTTFTKTEWAEFDIGDPRVGDYVKVDDKIFKRDDFSSAMDAQGLAVHLHSLHARLCSGENVYRPACALLTAGPAAGKTCLMSQVISFSLDHSELVPILVK